MTIMFKGRVLNSLGPLMVIELAFSAPFALQRGYFALPAMSPGLKGLYFRT